MEGPGGHEQHVVGADGSVTSLHDRALDDLDLGDEARGAPQRVERELAQVAAVECHGHHARAEAAELMFTYYTEAFGLNLPIWQQYLNRFRCRAKPEK